MPFRLAIDAGNFARDRRGMGRFARGVALYAFLQPDVELTFLLERSRDEAELRRVFSERPIRVAQSSQAGRSGLYDAVWYPWNGMRFAAAAPSLVTLHDVFAFTEPAHGFVARRREQGPILRTARYASRIATDSLFSRDEIVRVFKVAAERLAVVELAPDPFFTGGPVQPPPELAGRRFALFVAGPEPRKNATFLFEVAAQAIRAPDETLAIVGTLAPADERALHGAGVAHVRLDADDLLLRNLYRSAAIVCVPSLAEGFGLIAAEALACGAPVVASSSTSLPETTAGAALLAGPRDARAWVRAIRRVFDEPALAADLRRRALARFPAGARDEPARATLRLLRELSQR